MKQMLQAAMMDYPRIDTSEISDERKATQKFKSAYENMRQQLTAPGFIPILCAHEAAHVFYFIVAGARRFKPYPATLRYDEKLDDYSGSLASIQQLDLPQWTEGHFADWFSKVACAHAAGGVVARKLKPIGDVGDQDDEQRFRELCTALNASGASIDPEQAWNQAQSQVATDLQNAEHMMHIQQIAEAIVPELDLGPGEKAFFLDSDSSSGPTSAN